MEVGDIVIASGLEELGVIGEVQAKEYAHGRRLLGSLGHLQPEARQVSPAVEKFGASEKGEGEAPGRSPAICAVAQWTA